MQRRSGPVVFVIMDGVGYGLNKEADAVQAAYKPNLDWLHANCPNVPLNAHGTYVGLPSDADIGNSEVGHNAIGCGRVFAQGAKLVSDAIATGSIWQGKVWQDAIANVKKNNSKLHFLGLFSDGNVHSHIDHLKAMLKRAAEEGIKEIRVHCLLDGRDVGETSAMDYIVPFEAFLKEVNGQHKCNAKIASGGGRMWITMDRYNADWPMVERGWNVHVHGKGRQFATLEEAYTTLRKETNKIDQDTLDFVIAEGGKPVGKVEAGDSMILYNFRGDRAIEISQAFTAGKEFDKFERNMPKNIYYAGMMQYDGDLKLPENYLVTPPAIDRVSGEFVAKAGLTTLAISETQKYGHVTYFYNGNRSGYINEKLEKYIEVPSDNISFDKKPWMKCGEITDIVVDAIENKKYNHIRLNYPNGDMVGHTGVFEAVRESIEAMDT